MYLQFIFFSIRTKNKNRITVYFSYDLIDLLWFDNWTKDIWLNHLIKVIMKS